MTILNGAVQQTVELQKNLFNDVYQLWEKYTDNLEKITETLVEKNGNLPVFVKDNLKVVKDKTKEGGVRYKNLVDDVFKQWEKFLSNG